MQGGGAGLKHPSRPRHPLPTRTEMCNVNLSNGVPESGCKGSFVETDVLGTVCVRVCLCVCTRAQEPLASADFPLYLGRQCLQVYRMTCQDAGVDSAKAMTGWDLRGSSLFLTPGRANWLSLELTAS